MSAVRKKATAATRPAAAPAAAVAAATPQTRRKAAKAVAATPAKTAKPAKVAKPAKAADKAEKAEKPKKPKLVRDSFTIPKPEYAVLEDLKQRAARAGAPAKKSELLRAGIKALASMDEAQFLAAMSAVPALKTGRPAKA